MAKKPAVKLSVRQEWLRRHEEEGESPPKIAQRDGFDARTVRKQIQLAREERDLTESRQALLRQAMESHHKDLISFSEKLQKEVGRHHVSPSLKADPFLGALQEHLPKSQLWKSIDRVDRLSESLKALEQQVDQRFKKAVEGSTAAKYVPKAEGMGFRDGLSSALKHYCVSGENLLPPQLRQEGVEPGVIEICYNEWICAVVQDAGVQECKEFLTSLMTEACQWPQWQEIITKRSERDREIEAVNEEILVIRLRRIVPGKCKYCPL